MSNLKSQSSKFRGSTVLTHWMALSILPYQPALAVLVALSALFVLVVLPAQQL